MRQRKSWGRAFVALMATTAATAATAAQGEVRRIEAPADASWTHAGTGVVVPPTVASLARAELRDATPSEHDVMIGFESGAAPVMATLYLYRPGVEGAALWFDRAQAAITQRFGLAPAAPSAFAPPGSPVASAMRVAYDLPAGGPLTSTAVAIVPVGDWLAKVRLSSETLPAAALDAELARFVGGLSWPAAVATAQPAAPIAPCPQPLTFKPARLKKPDPAQVMLAALMPALPKAMPETGEPFCRDSISPQGWGIYRKGAATDAYVIAFSDAGRAMWVSRGLDLGADAGYGVTFLDVVNVSQYSAFDRLPSPDQAVRLLDSEEPLAVTVRGSGEVSISDRALQKK